MKKIFSFLTLFAFLFIGFIHNSMMVFAVDNNMEMNISEGNLCCISGNEENNKQCLDSCCAESSIDHGVSSINNNFNKKILKIPNTSFDINYISLYSFDNKNLVKKTSPPFYNRDISNYSYHTLIKIIKSNI